MLSPTNAILTGLASADLMVMIEYVPFVIHTSIENYPSTTAQNSYPWAVFTLFHTHFSVIFHSISSWLTVILAVWRYTSVRSVVVVRYTCRDTHKGSERHLTYYSRFHSLYLTACLIHGLHTHKRSLASRYWFWGQTLDIHIPTPNIIEQTHTH